MTVEQPHSLGWIGVGRMGLEMAARLLQAGYKLTVYNRTREKAAPLETLGASYAADPSGLANCDVVFTMLSNSDALSQVLSGPHGFLSGPSLKTKIIVDCSTISPVASAETRQLLTGRGIDFLAAPVSGNPVVVKSGNLGMIVSGSRQAFELVEKYLAAIAKMVSYAGEGESARIVKIGHNVLLGIFTQALAEVTVLAEKSGVSRAAFFDFINNSVIGSLYSRYKTPIFVELDYTTTFTPELMRKDLDLGLHAGHAHGVPLPLTSLTREIIQSMIGHGYTDCDFGALFELQARASGLELKPEKPSAK